MLELGEQLLESFGFDLDVNAECLPSPTQWPTVATEADGITADLDRYLPDVSDRRFIREEWVLAFCREDDKEVLPANVSDIRLAELLASPA